MFREAKDRANTVGTTTQAQASCLHISVVPAMFPTIGAPMLGALLGSHTNIALAQNP